MTDRLDRPEGTVRRGARLIGRLLRLHPRPFAVAVAGAAVYSLASVASSIVLQRVIDRVIVPRFDEGSTGVGTAVVAAVAIVVVGVVKSAGVVVRRTLAGATRWEVAGTLRRRVIDRYLDQPLTWFQGRPVGDLVGRAGVDVDAASEVVSPLPFASGVVVIVSVAGVSMLLADWVIGVVALAMFPVIGLVNVAYQRRVQPPAEAAQVHLGELAAVVHESFDGALVVKALGLEAAEAARLEPRAAALRAAKLRTAQLRAGFEALLDSIPALANVVVLVVGAVRVEAGALSVGEVGGFVFLFGLLVWPLRVIGWLLADLSRAVAGWERLEPILDGALARRPVVAPRPAGLELDSIGYGYVEGVSVLRDVGLEAGPGRIVALVGPTGSGKTTLLHLAAGLLRPTTGSVAAASGAPTIVFQEAFLFSGTVRDNVDLHGTLGDAEVWAALGLAQADGFVSALPAGIGTPLGERGVTLSGGQRQRLALARAIAARPTVLLLDDATSALDPTTEAQILGGLSTVLTGTTTVIVAHRPSTIGLADEVAFLVDGEVVDRGPHAELLARQVGYRRLVEAYERERRP
ncbi:MAG: ABC transporter ATP-binding protein [Acidimicrobiales bacterium]